MMLKGEGVYILDEDRVLEPCRLHLPVGEDALAGDVVDGGMFEARP